MKQQWIKLETQGPAPPSPPCCQFWNGLPLHSSRSSTTFMARACALQTRGLEIYDTIATAKSAANLVVRVEALARTCSASFGQWKPPTHHLQLQEAQSYMFMGFACSSLNLACCQATPLLLQTLVSCNTFESKAAILPSVAKPSAHVSPVSINVRQCSSQVHSRTTSI